MHTVTRREMMMFVTDSVEDEMTGGSGISADEHVWCNTIRIAAFIAMLYTVYYPLPITLV